MNCRKLLLVLVGVVIAMSCVVNKVQAEGDSKVLSAEMTKSLQENLKSIQTYFDAVNNATPESITTQGYKSMDELAEKKQVEAESTQYFSQRKTAQVKVARRDPFAITDRMFEGDPALRNLGLDFQPDAELKVPKIILKGVVNGANGKIAALVEIEEIGVIVVREGDTIGIQSKVGGGLRVKSISRAGLILTVGSLGQDVIIQ